MCAHVGEMGMLLERPVQDRLPRAALVQSGRCQWPCVHEGVSELMQAHTAGRLPAVTNPTLTSGIYSTVTFLKELNARLP